MGPVVRNAEAPVPSASTHSRLSITVLPVVNTCSSETPSSVRCRAAAGVGAKCQRAIRPMRLRLSSSGNGLSMTPVRSPASTWATGIFS